MDDITPREIVLMRRAAEDACFAMNRHYKPFIDAVAKPLTIIALLDLVQSKQAEVNELHGFLQISADSESVLFDLNQKKDKQIEAALALIDTTSYSEMNRRMPDFIEQLKEILRGLNK